MVDERRMTTASDWAAHLSAEGYSLRTQQAFPYVVRLFAQASGVEADALTREHVLAYLSRREYAPRTRNWYLGALSSWAEFAGLEGLTRDIRRPPLPRGVPKPVSETTLSRLLIACRPGSSVEAWIVLGAYAGLRSFESAKVCAEDLEESGGGWALRVKGKGGVEALVPASPILVDVLAPHVRRAGGRGRLWPRATAQGVQTAVARVAQTAGVRASSHQLRHRFGTAFYRAEPDLLLTQQVMRHASPSTTAGYALVVADQAAAVVARLPGAARAVGGMQ